MLRSPAPGSAQLAAPGPAAGATDAGMQVLGKAQHLQRVAIRGCAGVGAPGIAALLVAPKLTRVIVSRCPGVTAPGLEGLPNLRVMACGASGAGEAPADVQLLMGDS